MVAAPRLPAPVVATVLTGGFKDRHLPGMNEYTAACRGRGGWMAGSNMKKRTEDAIMWQLTGLGRMDAPCTIGFTWYEPSRRRDVDNIAMSAKFVMDALVKRGVLAGDSQKHVCGIWHEFKVDAENPRVVVCLHPARR